MYLKTLIRLLFTVLLPVLTINCLASTRPVHLRVENLDNPIGIDAAHPRLSWQIESDQRNVTQSAYQIMVARTDADLKSNRGSLWDSKRVSSDRTAQIICGGSPMISGARCFWKVRIWDENNKPSSWSAPAFWEMGILKPSDWHGKWIGRTMETSSQPAPMLRRTFTLKPGIVHASISICGLGYFELRCNGKKVGDHLRDPGYTRYDRRALYVTFDLTPYLHSGGNALGVLLGTGWYNVHTQAVWNFDKAPWRAAPKMLAELRVQYANGSSETIVSDEKWKTSTGPILFDSIYSGETYDARLEKSGWDAPAYLDGTWTAAKIVDAPGGLISAQQMPPIRLDRSVTPVKLTEPKPGVFLFDLGQNMAGHARLKVRGPAGSKIVMKFGERLTSAGMLDQSQIGQHIKKTDPPQQFQTDTYITKGVGEEVWEPRFDYHGFQYVEMTGFPGKPTLDNLQGEFVHTSVEPAGGFTCSNPMLNRIWANARWSYLSNLQSIPTDCPHREKNGWTGDAHLAAEQGLYNFDSIAIYEKWINDLGDEQKQSGELPGIVPSGGWGYEWGNGPAWDSAFVLIPWYLYQYYGDTNALANHYEGMRRYVDYLTTKATKGIVSIGLGDWAPFETETPTDVTSTGYYYQDTKIVAETAALLGRKEDAQKYSALADSIRDGFNAKFYHANNSGYANNSQTALSCALYQGLVEPQNRQAVLNSLVSSIDKRDGHIDTGILGAKYLLNTLTDNGRADVAYRIASQKTLPGWGYWLEQGATTLWESWRGTDSLNHIMFGDISAWFYKTLAGINGDPKAPGFKHIIIRPHIVGDLTSASAYYNSIHGTIRSSWSIGPKGLSLQVSIPSNTSATVYLPTANPNGVLESGKPVRDSNEINYVRSEAGSAIYEIGSGNYSFVSPPIATAH